MKLTYYQLEKQLNHKLLPAYIVSSDEIILKEESIQLIRQKALADGFADRVRLIVETGFNWEELYNQLHSGSLFSVKRLIELNLTRALPNKTGHEILQRYAENPSPDTLLIINIGKMDIKTSKSTWCTLLEKVGALITIWPIPHEQLPQWILRRAKANQLDFNLKLAALLADYVEGNLIAAAQAIEKLAVLKTQEPINEDVIKQMMIDESRYTIFEFIESTIAGNSLRSLHILEQLRAEGTEPTLILWHLTREIRLLAEIAQHVKAGYNLDNLLHKQRIFFKRLEATKKFLQRYTPEDCWHFLAGAIEIDKIIKGIQVGHVWDALQLFCLRIGTGDSKRLRAS